MIYTVVREVDTKAIAAGLELSRKVQLDWNVKRKIQCKNRLFTAGHGTQGIYRGAHMSDLLKIDATMAGRRLDQVLSERFPQYPKSEWIALFKLGMVRVDDRKMRPEFRLPAGAELQILSWPTAPMMTQIKIEILHSDEQLLVLNKPAQCIVHPTPQTPRGSTLIEQLWQAEGDQSLQLLHRLDFGTSGVLLCAKSPMALHHWQEILQKSTTNKIYHALVWGDVKNDTGSIDKKIVQLNSAKVALSDKGKSALTHYRVVRRFGVATELELEIPTGRMHQIRIHLSSLGHPVIGDVQYGADRNLERKYKSKRIYLHAYKLLGEGFEFCAEIPGAFEGMTTRLVDRQG